MILAAVVSFIAAFALGSGTIYFLPAPQAAQAEAVSTETIKTEIISPLADADVLGETDVTEPSPSLELIPSPISEPTPTPTPRPTPKPIPTPTPLPTAATAVQMDTWFTQYSGSQSVSIEMLRKIAVCESGYNQFAQNEIYGGLFQFSSSTWVSTRLQMNADSNPDLRFNAEEAIKTAAFRIATIGSAAWPNCSK